MILVTKTSDQARQSVCMYVCVCIFIKLHITAQSGPVVYVCTVCMYECMYACMYVCMYVSMYLCIYVSMYVSMYLCIYVSMYLCIYVSMYLCIYVSMYVSMYLCIYVFMVITTYSRVQINRIWLPILLVVSCDRKTNGKLSVDRYFVRGLML